MPVALGQGFHIRKISWRNSKSGRKDWPIRTPTVDEKAVLGALRDALTALINARGGQYPTYEFDARRNRHTAIADPVRVCFTQCSDTDILPDDAERAAPLYSDQLFPAEATAELLGVSEYVETMQMRIRTLLSDSRMKIVSGAAQDLTLDDWLRNYIGDNQGPMARSPSSTFAGACRGGIRSSPP